jgi:hypothetical protein
VRQLVIEKPGRSSAVIRRSGVDLESADLNLPAGIGHAGGSSGEYEPTARRADGQTAHCYRKLDIEPQRSPGFVPEGELLQGRYRRVERDAECDREPPVQRSAGCKHASHHGPRKAIPARP